MFEGMILDSFKLIIQLYMVKCIVESRLMKPIVECNFLRTWVLCMLTLVLLESIAMFAFLLTVNLVVFSYMFMCPGNVVPVMLYEPPAIEKKLEPQPTFDLNISGGAEVFS